MAIAVLFPLFDHPAIEERYASWQAELRLRSGADELRFWPHGSMAADAVAEVLAEHVLVVTDPLLLAPRGIGPALLRHLHDADAVVPVSNTAAAPSQVAALPSLYLTLRELDLLSERLAETAAGTMVVTWADEDPALFLCRTELLDAIEVPLHRALAGKRVAVSRGDYVHRWASMRGQVRDDLLSRIPADAASILEFGCGEGSLGAAIKQRQKCRVAGIELDPDAAAIAKRRIDVVYQGDTREVISILHERFDWIVGGDIVEHLDDPWSFLGELRRIAAPGGHLLLSLPNIASASIIADLLAGRFDYVYMGLTCVGHLRFFTRKSIEEMLAISGWLPVEIAPQDLPITPPAQELIGRLEAAGVPFSREDLLAPGYYVIARNG
ncbi:MAG TPA: class I SAM-dependent methyltransferase [Thermoanaerobaculia bacterium]|nr:class I SAM-dependent methyltransferase [Thermoanaerobaculia bacterium]